MKAVERHLYIRNGYYYFRKFTPRNLNDFLPFREIWLGLDTQDLSVARVQVAQLDYEFKKHLNQLRQGLCDLSPDQSPDVVVHNFVSAINKVKDAYGYEPPSKYSHIKKRGKHTGGLSERSFRIRLTLSNDRRWLFFAAMNKSCSFRIIPRVAPTAGSTKAFIICAVVDFAGPCSPCKTRIAYGPYRHMVDLMSPEPRKNGHRIKSETQRSYGSCQGQEHQA